MKVSQRGKRRDGRDAGEVHSRAAAKEAGIWKKEREIIEDREIQAEEAERQKLRRRNRKRKSEMREWDERHEGW